MLREARATARSDALARVRRVTAAASRADAATNDRPRTDDACGASPLPPLPPPRTRHIHAHLKLLVALHHVGVERAQRAAQAAARRRAQQAAAAAQERRQRAAEEGVREKARVQAPGAGGREGHQRHVGCEDWLRGWRR